MAPPSGYTITPSRQQPTRSANDTAEFRRNYGANEFVNGLHALDSGYTGQGVTIGIIDDGVVNVNGELDGRIDTDLSRDFGYVTTGGVQTKRNALGDANADHGTPIANIIAARRDGSGTVGFAPSATLAVLRVSDWNEDTQTEALTHAVEALDYAGRKGLKIINSSLSSGASQVYGNAITRFGATGGLIINSAGNSSGTSPIDAGAINASNRNAIIFVGALSGNINAYTMEGYSNLAGSMMDRYVVAVGTNVTTSVSGTVGLFSGTSSSTPVVSALAATILSKWPQLTGQQAGEVILNTTKDLGAPGVDEVFGRGLVDFKAALSPINPSLSNGARQTSILTSVMAVPGAMGVGSIQTALSNVTVLDEYGRDFTGSISDLVIKPEARPGQSIRRRVQQMSLGGATSIASGALAGSFGFVSDRVGPLQGEVRTRLTAGGVQYVADGYGFRLGWNAQDSMQSDAMGLAPFANGILAYVPQADNSFGIDRYVGGGKLGLTVSTGHPGEASARAVTLGWTRSDTDVRVSLVDENGTIMGSSTGQGALRLGRGATTALVEANRAFPIGTLWRLEGYGSLGLTRLKIDQASLVTGSSAIIGSRLGVQATRQALGGVLSLGIAQPLTIEDGSARLTYGSGYNLQNRSLLYRTATASLAGERRLQLTAGFTKESSGSSLRMGLMQDVSDGSTQALANWIERF